MFTQFPAITVRGLPVVGGDLLVTVEALPCSGRRSSPVEDSIALQHDLPGLLGRELVGRFARLCSSFSGRGPDEVFEILILRLLGAKGCEAGGHRVLWVTRDLAFAGGRHPEACQRDELPKRVDRIARARRQARLSTSRAGIVHQS